MTINTETIRDAAEVLDTLTSALAVDHPLRTQAAARAKSCVSGLYSAADAIDAQATEIDRLRNMAWTNGDVLKESQAETVKLRAELAHLRAVLSQALMALEGYLPNHRNDVTDRAIAVARAALSGESNG